MENSLKVEIGKTYLDKDDDSSVTVRSVDELGGVVWYLDGGFDYLNTFFDHYIPAVNPQTTSSTIIPSHYNATKISALDVIDDWKLDFRLGNTIKYIQRHEHKGNPLEDLKKAQQYLALKIKQLEDANNSKSNM